MMKIRRKSRWESRSRRGDEEVEISLSNNQSIGNPN